jgi:hypothetical protein
MNGYGYLYGGFSGAAWNWVNQHNDALDTIVARTNGGISCYACRGFGLNGFGYVIGGVPDGTNNLSQFLQYNDTTNVIATMSATRVGHWITALSLNGFGYGFGGSVNPSSGTVLSDCVQYNDVLDTLTVKAFSSRTYASGFALNGYGYIVAGTTGTETLVTTQYCDATNTTLTVANANTNRVLSIGHTLDGRGYVTTGYTGSTVVVSSVEMFNDASRSWFYRAVSPLATYAGQGYSLNGSGYIAGSFNGTVNVSTVVQYGSLEKAIRIAATLMIEEGEVSVVGP